MPTTASTRTTQIPATHFFGVLGVVVSLVGIVTTWNQFQIREVKADVRREAYLLSSTQEMKNEYFERQMRTLIQDQKMVLEDIIPGFRTAIRSATSAIKDIDADIIGLSSTQDEFNGDTRQLDSRIARMEQQLSMLINNRHQSASAQGPYRYHEVGESEIIQDLNQEFGDQLDEIESFRP